MATAPVWAPVVIAGRLFRWASDSSRRRPADRDCHTSGCTFGGLVDPARVGQWPASSWMRLARWAGVRSRSASFTASSSIPSGRASGM
eukprot:2126528-Heterocapsa_arctica.AAC.1